MNSSGHAGMVTLLFTDIEGSTRLWEQEPARMPFALACHDALARAAVEDHGGIVVKMIGDGLQAAFDDPLDAVAAALQFQNSLADSAATHGISLRVRCGMHAGAVEQRDNDFFGGAVNRASRIMGAAHGGQILVSLAVATRVGGRLPMGVVLRDLGSVRLRDLSTPEHVYQIVAPDLRQDFPSLRSLEATPNNLPQQVTSFVGRERGLADVRNLLVGTRLLTLLGMGGLGKTRLSLQMAADVLDDYSDGVWFVELASVADARLVPQAVASVLGVIEEAGRPVLEALVKFVKDRQLLVILDNCEHLLHACAELTRQLLQAGARLKVLTSSREPLHVPGETTYPVPALALPDPRQSITIEALMEFDAVRLFVDRAVTVQPAFKVTPGNARALAEICQRLDGIPLAIELAAANVRSLSVEKIAERLSDRFRLLTRGSRTALPRQQTLRALIDWSFDLLRDGERTLLQRLSVFAAGFTLEAAEAVGAGGDIDRSTVLELLTALVEKSLVELDPGGERYRFLETVRQYAQEKLVASGEGEQARTRHLDFFVAFAEKVRPELWGEEQGKWLARLDLDRENLLSAHARCDHAQDGAESGLRLVFAVQLYWFPRGLIELGYRITVEALLRPGAQQRTLSRSGALYAASQLGYFMGRYEETAKHAQECISIAYEHANQERAAAALLMQGYACDALGQRAAAQRHFEESAKLARALGDKAHLSFALNALAGHHSEAAELGAAESLFDESLALSREIGDRDSIAIVLPNLAKVALERGSVDRARELLREAVMVAQDIGSTRAGQNALEVASGLAVLCADWERAARIFGSIEAQLEQMGLRRTPADEAFLASRIAKARAALGDAAFAAAEAAGRSLTYDDALDEVRAWLQTPPRSGTPRSV
jgi:predicted ATPase/class 3 adenylate cyclase